MEDFIAKLSTGDWTISSEALAGVTCNGKVVVIFPKLIHSKEYLDTCIHEIIHATLENASESETARVAGDITKVLWKLGFRLNPKKRTKRRAKKRSK